MSELGAHLDISATASGLKLAGEIDAHTAPVLADALTELPTGDVVLDAEAAQAGEAVGLRARRRVHGIDRHDHAVAGLHETDGRVRHADIGLEAAEHGRPAAGRRDRRHDLRAGGQPEDRLGEHRRAAADGQQHSYGRRPVACRIFLGEDCRHIQGHRGPRQPGGASSCLARLFSVALVQPVAPELGLQIDDDEDGVVAVEQRHGGLHGVTDLSAAGPPQPAAPARYHRDVPFRTGRVCLSRATSRVRQLARTSHAERTPRDGLLGEVGRARRRRFTRARPTHTLGLCERRGAPATTPVGPGDLTPFRPTRRLAGRDTQRLPAEVLQ
jgi:hypothetical protein